MAKTYTKDQIKRAKALFKVLFPGKCELSAYIFYTEWGKKTNTGVINTILNIAYSPDFSEKKKALRKR